MRIIKLLISTAILFFLLDVSAMDFQLNGNINESYDDNINSSATDSSADWITDIGLGVAFLTERKDLDFLLSGNMYQQLYVINTEENSNYQDLNFLFRKSINHLLSVRLSDKFENYPDSRDLNALFGRNDGNAAYISNSVSAGIKMDFTEKFSADLEYNNQIKLNDDDELEDTVLHNPQLILTYFINSANILRTGYGYSFMQYSSSDSQGHDLFAEYERYLTKQLRSIINGGCDYLETDEDSNITLRWKISLIDDFDKRNQISISYLKENILSSVRNDVFSYWKINGILKRQVSRRISVGTEVFYGEGYYVESRLKDRLGGVTALAGYDLNRFLQFNLSYTYTRKFMTGPDINDSEYDRNQISAGITGLY